MSPELVFYLVAIPAVALLGLSKGGFAGVGAVAMPMIALTTSPVRAAAVVLPILIVQDVVSVWAFRKTWDRYVLAVMLPSAAVGILAGYLLAARVSIEVIMALLGAISILFALQRLWIERGGRIVASARSPAWAGSLYGAAAGFTSQIAHAGGPPFQMWVMPRKLGRDEYIGTSAIFFAAVNWMKAPAYLALGQFTPANLFTSAMLLPVAILSTLAGVKLVRRFDAERLFTIIYALMILTGAKLIWDAFA